MKLPRRKNSTEDVGSVQEKPDDMLNIWPVYLLWGNGDVYALLTTVNQKL